MDEIFHHTTSIWDVVKVANDTPRRYGKNGELLVSYLDTEEAAGHTDARRQSSIAASARGKVGADRHEFAPQEKMGISHNEGSGSASSSRGEKY